MVPMFAYFFIGQQCANRLSSRINGDAEQDAMTAGLAFLRGFAFASAALMPRPVKSTATARTDAITFSMDGSPQLCHVRKVKTCRGCQKRSCKDWNWKARRRKGTTFCCGLARPFPRDPLPALRHLRGWRGWGPGFACLGS